MARITCTQCGSRTGSYVHTARTEDGHGTKPICDPCAGIIASSRHG